MSSPSNICLAIKWKDDSAVPPNGMRKYECTGRKMEFPDQENLRKTEGHNLVYICIQFPEPTTSDFRTCVMHHIGYFTYLLPIIPYMRHHSALLVYCTLGKLVCLASVSGKKGHSAPLVYCTSGELICLTGVSMQERSLCPAGLLYIVKFGLSDRCRRAGKVTLPC